MRRITNIRRSLRFEALEHRDLLATFTVTNNDEIGHDDTEPFGSLGWAIAEANANPGWDEIDFDPEKMAGKTILVDPSAFWAAHHIFEPVLIRGLDRSLYAPVTLAAPSPGTGNGLVFRDFTMPNGSFANKVGVENLNLINFDIGIEIRNIDEWSSSNSAPLTIRGMRITNTTNGIVFNDADVPFKIEENYLDGRGTGQGVGIDLAPNSYSENPSLIGNIEGEQTIPQIIPEGTGNVIIDFATGIRLTGGQFLGGFSNLQISGNRIGAQSNGTARPNTVGILATSNNLSENHSPISGQKIVHKIDNNDIAFNLTHGILFEIVDGTLIEGNLFLQNGGHGIDLQENAELHSIVSNTFNSNGLDAVSISNGNLGGSSIYPRAIRISGNDFLMGSPVSDSRLPIDLSADGRTPNDETDFDLGPNSLLNYPVVIDNQIQFDGTHWNIPIKVRIYDGTARKFEFYRFSAADNSYHFIRHENVTTPPSLFEGVFSFENGVELSPGDQLAVLAINEWGSRPGATSEMGDLSGPLPDLPPTITDVVIRGTQVGTSIPWHTSAEVSMKERIEAGKQFYSIATAGANTIDVYFSEPITIENAAGFELQGKNGVVITPTAAPQLDSTGTRVTLTFATLDADKYALHILDDAIADLAGLGLDGNWQDKINLDAGTPDNIGDDPPAEFNIGDGSEGSDHGRFRLHFAYLPGDFDSNRIVEAATGNNDDLASGVLGDFNGDGVIDASDEALTIAQHGNILSLYEIGGADLNDDEVVDGLDLTIWQNGYGGTTQGDVNGDGVVDGRDFLLWQRAFGSKSAWYIDPPAVSAITVGLPPQVMNVIISGSLSVHDPHSFDTVAGSGAQLATVPVGLADTISIVFSENVNVSASSLIVVGMTTANVPELAEFSYDPLTFTATWRFEGWALGDNYLLHLSDSITDTEGNFLDGEWTNPASISTTNSLVSTFPSGDGESGGAFIFAMTLLPGDANLDGLVDMDDYDIYMFYRAQDGSFTEGDFDGDGTVGTEDFNLLDYNWLNNLDLRNPFLLSDLDEDGDVDDDDLAVLSDNYGLTGADWEDGDLNSDGVIDDLDLDLAFAQYGLRFANFVA